MSTFSAVAAQPSRVQESSWTDYAVRFLFGGVITAVVGILARAFGPVVAGLFLAFPAILPASLTLIAQHDGKQPAAFDAAGAVIGSVGLAAFGAVVWGLSSRLSGVVVLALAMVAWAVVSGVLWPFFHEAEPNR
ncbi:MAG TPA: DUF3147 family protein [Chloroflexota bacterium]|nr:DUF3147 family protein [Chloroflexota bacterium]